MFGITASQHFGVFGAREGDEPPGQAASNSQDTVPARQPEKQFPSVNLAFHGPLARSHIFRHDGPTLSVPLPFLSVC